MAGVLLQAGLWHVLTASPLYVARVRERLLRVHPDIGHVAWRHVGLWYSGSALLGWEMRARGLFWGVRAAVIHAVLTACGGLGSIQTGLQVVSLDARCIARQRPPWEVLPG